MNNTKHAPDRIELPGGWYFAHQNENHIYLYDSTGTFETKWPVDIAQWFAAAMNAQAQAALAADSAQSQWNTDMSAAPKDGTIINVVARYPMATAGSPTYAGYYEGRWYEYSKNPPEVVIPWAWRPRDKWPQEPAAPAAEEFINGDVVK